MAIRMGLIAAVVGLLGACATPPPAWEKPGASAAEVKRYTHSCQAFAAAEAERRYRHEYPREASGLTGPGDAFQATMVGNDAALFKNKVFSECMQTYGFRRIGAAAKP